MWRSLVLAMASFLACLFIAFAGAVLLRRDLRARKSYLALSLGSLALGLAFWATALWRHVRS